MKDPEIILFSHRIGEITFFTCDGDFHKKNLCHPNYYIVHLAVGQSEVATFIRLPYFISLKASKTDFLSGSHNQDIFILKLLIILEVTHVSSEKVDLAVGQ